MKNLDLAAMKERCAAATEGPWKSVLSNIDELPDEHRIVMAFTPDGFDDLDYANLFHGDLDFIAHARQDVPELIVGVEERDQWIDEFRELLSVWQWQATGDGDKYECFCCTAKEGESHEEDCEVGCLLKERRDR